MQELLHTDYKIQTLLGTSVFFQALKDDHLLGNIPEVCTTDEESLSRAGHLQTNNTALAIVEQPKNPALSNDKAGYTLVLDNVSDPGNLGTILRIADWYGIQHIVCSPKTTDVYNPKVISASMGSFLRVYAHYTDLEGYLSTSDKTIYGACVGEGGSVHNTDFKPSGILLMGSESHGVSSSLEQYIHQKVTIPSYGKAESLNVSISTGIICDNILRYIGK